MNQHASGVIGVFLCVFLSSAASAANLAIVPKVGTLGAGLDISAGWSESWSTRLTINGLTYSDEFDESGIAYDGDLDLRTAGLLLDWHPGGGVFRLSAGAFYNGNEGALTGKPTGGTFVFNGVTYPASAVESLTGEATFEHFAPYLGIGFSNAGKKGWKFAVDLGALYQNSPQVGLQVQCSAALTPAQCTTLQGDVQAEEAQLEDELSNYKWYPVFSIGIGYSF